MGRITYAVWWQLYKWLGHIFWGLRSIMWFPLGIRSEWRLALGVAIRHAWGNGFLGKVSLLSEGLSWGSCFRPALRLSACGHSASTAAWDPERRQPRITSRDICFCICAWILLTAGTRPSSLTILPTFLPVIDVSAEQPLYLHKWRGMEDDYLTVLHLFLLNNCSNQGFIFGALSADIGSFGFIKAKIWKSPKSNSKRDV